MTLLPRLHHILSRPLLSSLLLSQNGGRETMTRIGKNASSLSYAVELGSISAEASDLECDVTHDDVKAAEKNNALCLAVSQLASEFSKESMLSLQKFFGVRHAHVISTGSFKLDLALGIGGLPKGRMVELYGREAVVRLHLHFKLSKRLKSLEVAALIPKSEIDQVGVGTKRDVQSRLMTQALQKIHYSLSHSQTLIVFINQIRLSPKSVKERGSVEEVTCGGNALKFYAAVRLRLSRLRLIKTEDKVEGVQICAQVVKNKLAPAELKRAELGIKFGRGFCHESEVLDLACEHGIIVKDEGIYFIEGASFDSREAAEVFLAQNDAICDKLVNDMRRLYF